MLCTSPATLYYIKNNDSPVIRHSHVMANSRVQSSPIHRIRVICVLNRSALSYLSVSIFGRAWSRPFLSWCGSCTGAYRMSSSVFCSYLVCRSSAGFGRARCAAFAAARYQARVVLPWATRLSV